MEILLPQELTGREIIAGLSRIAAEFGLSISYLPIIVAYANVNSSERRFYTRIAIRGVRAKIEIGSKVAQGSLDAGERYRAITLNGDESSFERLADFIECLPDGLAQEPPERATDTAFVPETTETATYHSPLARDYSREFQVLVVSQGEYGQRIFENLRRRAPSNWSLIRFDLTQDLPVMIDDPSSLVPDSVPQVDLVLFLSQNSNAPQLIGDFVRRTGARALIAPIDCSEWMPSGQVNQIKHLLEKWGVECAFPRPFCSLTETGTPAIDEFARKFGRPIIEIESEDTKTVKMIKVTRGSPCGCTEFVAENVKGEKLDSTVEKAALTHHHYPCLASMVREPDLDDTLMHASGFITKSVFEEQVKKFLKRGVGYLDPSRLR